MAIGISRTGNARNNYLYGTQDDDTLDGGAGDDYLRGYSGNDYLIGGAGRDRFVFERTWAANGTDTLADFQFGTDIIDLSLVGFARGVFNRNIVSDVIRMDYGANGTTRLLIDLDGGGDNFQTWAIFANAVTENVSQVNFAIGSLVVPPVTVIDYPIALLNFSVLNATQLSVTANAAGSAQLFVKGSGTPGTPVVGPAATLAAANVAATLTVQAQASLTEAELRVTDGGTPAVSTTPVYLGSNNGESINASGNADIIFGFGGNDSIVAGNGADTVFGHEGDDQITGGAGADSLSGGDGNDTFIGFVDADTLDGGLNNDTLVLATTSLDLNAAADAAITGLEVVSAAGATEGAIIDLRLQSEGFTIVGTGFDDSVVTSTGADTITTGSGADVVVFGTQGSLAAKIDTITDYVQQTLDFAGNAVLAGAGGVASAGASVQTSANGKVTFAGTDDTLAEKIAALQADARLDAANTVAVFSDGADAYLYYAGTATGNTDDQVVRLQGRSILDKIMVDGAGNITLDREPPSGALTTVTSLLPTATSWQTPATAVIPAGFTPGNDGNANTTQGDGVNGPTSNLIRNASGGFGTALFSHNTDDASAPVAVNVTLWSAGLNMYGTNYTTVYAGSNGYLTFGVPVYTWEPQSLATFTLAPMIAAQFDDLLFGTGPFGQRVVPGAGDGTSLGTENLYYYADDSKMVFTWDNADMYFNWAPTSSSSGNLGPAFQIILHKPTGDAAAATNFGIEIRYEEVTQAFPTAVAGWTAGDQLNYGQINPTGTVLSTVAEQSSNVGVAGVWAWEVRGGAVVSPYYVPDIGITTAQGVADLKFRNASGITGFTITGDGNGYGFTMGPATSSGVNMTARLSTIANPHWNLWKNAYMDGQATLTITPTGGVNAVATTIRVDIVKNGTEDPVTRTGDQTGTDVLTVAATSADLNTAGNAELSGVTTVTAAAAAAGVQINLSNQTESFTLIAGSGHNDTLIGSSGADTLAAGAGNDVLRYTAGAALGLDAVDGEGDVDTIEITAADTGIVDAHFTNVSNVEKLQLTGASSAVLGTQAAQAGLATGSGTIQIGSGATSITANDSQHFTIDASALAQNTVLTLADGATSNFTVTGLVGNLATDALAGTLTVTTADAADDGISIETAAGATAVNLSAGAATDTVSIDAADLANDVALTLNAAGAAAAGTVNISNLQGDLVLTNASSGTMSVAVADNTVDNDIHITAGATNLSVTAVANGDTVHVTALTGNFTGAIAGTTGKFNVVAGAGAQTITTGAGDDTITGGAGADTIDGGDGANRYVYATTADFVSAGAVVDSVTGGAGTDTIQVNAAIALATTDTLATRLVGVEQLAAETQAADSRAHSIVLDADAKLGSITTIDLSGDTNAASTGVINLSGVTTTGLTLKGVNGGGNNTLTGGAGVDSITGGAGADTITGGAGADNMDGGDGADVFIIAAAADHAAGETIVGGNQTDVIRFTSTADGTLVLTANVNVEEARITDAAGLATGVTAESIDATNAVGAVALYGNAGANRLTGNGSANVIVGGAGNDTITGGAGADNLDGGDGADVFIIAAAADHAAGETIVGGNQTDVIRFTSTAAGTLVLTANVNVEEARITDFDGSAFDTTAENIDATNAVGGIALYGNDGDNRLTGNGLANVIDGRWGNDTLTGGAGADILIGGDGDDVLVFATAAELAGDATVVGGDGADTIRMDTGADALILDSADFAKVADVETLALNGTGAQQVTLGAQTSFAFIGGITITTQATAISLNLQGALSTVSITATGTNNADTLVGGTSADSLAGGTGADTITGGAWADSIDGGAGADVLVFASAADLSGDATVMGSDDTDTIRMDTNGAALTLASTDFANVTTVETLALNGTGAQQVTLGAQTDAAFASGITITTQAAAVSLNLQGALSTVGITATGTNNGDTLTGGSANDSLTGGDGNDTLTGGAGIDTLLGGDGDDVFVYANVSDLTDGSIGVDDVDGGAHVNGDIISLIQTSAITIAGGMEGRLRNIEQLHVDAANANAISISLNWDNITNTGINTIDLAGDTDAAGTNTVNLWDTSTNFTVIGSAGSDLITAGAGDINANAGDGDDTLTGHTGNDSLTGGAGADTLTGGGGADQFALQGDDTVTDFNSTQLDTVVLTALADGDSVTFSTVTGTLDLSGPLTTAAFTATAVAAGATITGGAGNDSLAGAEGDDSLAGSGGADTLTGGAGNDTLRGGAGNDILVFNTGDVGLLESIDGGDDADVILVQTATDFTNLGAVRINTDAHIEHLRITSGQSATFTGAQLHQQTVTVNATAAGAATLNINVASGANVSFSNLSFTSFDGADAFDTGVDAININGAGGDETIEGTALADVITGGAGADILFGGAGNDTLVVDDADTLVDGDAGTDTLAFAASATFLGTELANVEAATATADGANLTVSYLDVKGANNIAVFNGFTDSGSAVEQLIVMGDDSSTTLDYSSGLTLNNAQLVVYGDDQDDNITGTAGSDILDGGRDVDTITGGAGADTIYGGSGADVFVYNSGDSYGLAGKLDTVTDFNSGEDKFKFFLNGNVVNVSGYSVGDGSGGVGTTIGSSYFARTDNAIYMNAGGQAFGTAQTYVVVIQDGMDVLATDLIFDIAGTGGDDALTGGAGADTITGGAGADTITGCAGADSLTGGDGSDTFVFAATNALNGSDTVTGFTAGAAGDILDFADARTVFDGTDAGTNDDFGLISIEANVKDASVYGTNVFALIDNADGSLVLADLISGAGSNAGQVIVADGTDAIVLVGNDAADQTLNAYRVYDADAGATVTAAIESLGTVLLAGVATLDSLMAANVA